MMLRNRKYFPWHKLITHRFAYEQCQEAMVAAKDPEALKVVFAPKDA
jgi:threonine dehydrogenase-like Zn-dependent dehydrogenase